MAQSQKPHPYGLRLRYNKAWYGEGNVAKTLHGDLTAGSAQLRRLERGRNALVSEFGALSRDEVAALAGGRETVARWEQDGLIFSVAHQGRSVYPSFQFDRQGPRPVIAQTLAGLGAETSPWGIALWLTAANGWLGGRRPVDLLDTEPEAVADAVRREALELVF